MAGAPELAKPMKWHITKNTKSCSAAHRRAAQPHAEAKGDEVRDAHHPVRMALQDVQASPREEGPAARGRSLRAGAGARVAGNGGRAVQLAIDAMSTADVVITGGGSHLPDLCIRYLSGRARDWRGAGRRPRRRRSQSPWGK